MIRIDVTDLIMALEHDDPEGCHSLGFDDGGFPGQKSGCRFRTSSYDELVKGRLPR